MAQELFDGHQIGPGIQKVGGERMPERVDAEALIGSGLLQKLSDGPLDGPVGQPTTL